MTVKTDWIKMDPAMITLLVNMIQWVVSVEAGFLELGGNPNAMKTCYEKQV